jgi:electron transfer flavoprotein beta subunit
MRILTLIRQVLDAEESVRMKAGAVDLSSSKLVVDTMDEYGLEQALRLRDADATVEVVALAVGPVRAAKRLCGRRWRWAPIARSWWRRSRRWM